MKKNYLALLFLLTLTCVWFGMRLFFSSDVTSVVAQESLFATIYEVGEHSDVANKMQMPEGEEAVLIDLDSKQVIVSHNNKNMLFHMTRKNSPSLREYMKEGVYVVDEKVRERSSTVSMSRFPYYVVFGDHYAIYGTPITGEEASGSNEELIENGVQLSIEDARALYDLVREGMPVYVLGASNASDLPRAPVTLSYETLPATSAFAYTVSDIETGDVLLTKSGDDRYPIASITKLLTALVASDVVGHGRTLAVSGRGRFTLSDLFYPLLLRSDNTVAEHIADYAGKDFFLSNMNAYARAIGMTKSTFTDASGLSPKNVSTANDLSVLARHMYLNKAYLFDITKEDDMTITSDEGVVWSMENQNVLAGDPFYRGGKLGYTDEAGQTSLAVFEIPLGDHVRPVAIVVLRSKDWKQDTRTLVRWLLENEQ